MFYVLIESETFPRWHIGDMVMKKSGASWHGKVVGFYSTALTPVGYCVESMFEANSVQIYPESALTDYVGDYERPL